MLQTDAEREAALGHDVTAMKSKSQTDRELIEQLTAEASDQREKVAHLEFALNSARTIGAAIGILMEREHLSEDAAFELLSDMCQRANRKVRDVAAEFVYTGMLPASVRERP